MLQLQQQQQQRRWLKHILLNIHRMFLLTFSQKVSVTYHSTSDLTSCIYNRQQ